jgi:hypothetical protein
MYDKMKFEDIKTAEVIKLLNEVLEQEYLSKPIHFVPIDYSKLVNGGIFSREDVVYSSACRITRVFHDKVGTRKEQPWITHLLLTRSIIAFLTPGVQEGVWVETYSPWIHTESLDFFKDSFKYKNLKFEAVRIDKYEPKESFKTRSKEFGKICALLWALDHLERAPKKMLIDNKFRTKMKGLFAQFYDKKLKRI